MDTSAGVRIVTSAMAAVWLGAGCSVKSMATAAIADTLASGGGRAYAADDDPDLIADALPFALKLHDTVLEEQPDHVGLLLATARVYSLYAQAVLAERADRLAGEDLHAARTLRLRARGLFLRGRDYALRGLALEHPGLPRRIRRAPREALAETGPRDAGLLYWAGAAWVGAAAIGPNDLELVAELPAAEALLRRALALDERYEDGAIHETFIRFEGQRPGEMGGSAERARQHYARAVELSGGRRASVHVALAEAVSVPAQSLLEFSELLDLADAVDSDSVPELRLVNVIAQRRAAWLRTQIPELFLDADSEGENR